MIFTDTTVITSQNLFNKLEKASEVDIEGRTYLIGHAFRKNRWNDPSVNLSRSGNYSNALFAYKYLKEGSLKIDTDGDSLVVRYPEHEIYVDIGPGYSIASRGEVELSAIGKSTVLSVLAMQEYPEIVNATPEEFCDCVYFGFAKNVGGSVKSGIMSDTEFTDAVNSVCNDNLTAKHTHATTPAKKKKDNVSEWFEKAKAGEYIIDYEWEDDDKTKIVPLSFLDDVIPTKELMRLAMLINGATSKALERMKAGLPLSSKYVLNIQIPGDVGSGKTMAVSALSAIFGMPLYATTAEPDQGVEIIEGESKTVDSALAFVQSPAGKATRNGGINFIDEFIEGDTDRMFSAFAQLTEYPYHFYENGYEEVQRHPLSVFIVAYNNGIEGGSTIAQPLISRFNHVVKFETQGKKLFIDLLKQWAEDSDISYDIDTLCNWIYDAYERTVNALKDKRPDIAMAFSLRSCRAILDEIAWGVEPQDALSCLWGIVEHYDADEAENIKKGVLATLRKL